MEGGAVTARIEPALDHLSIFAQHESAVRSYSRCFPDLMAKARGSTITTESGREVIDFLSGAGTLNYGHNPAPLKQAIMNHLSGDGIVHALDMATPAKREFLDTFWKVILEPRGFDYKVQFPGPTGTNAVEAALKLARKVTGRSNVIAFTNGFHGVTQGALAATANRHFREASGLPPSGVTFMPFDGYLGDQIRSDEVIDRFLSDSASGIDRPAAVLLETVQGEGGVNVGSFEWLRSVERLCRKHDALLIVDDVQMGCGRTGPFFSFEPAEIRPDIVLLSKSLSGIGLPLSAVLIRPDLDVWKAGEHNGTFRCNSLALVAAAKALRSYWSDASLSDRVNVHGARLADRAREIADRKSEGGLRVRSRGMVIGLECDSGGAAARIASRAFAGGLMVECCGSQDQVLKLLPPLTASVDELESGCDILEDAVIAEFR